MKKYLPYLATLFIAVLIVAGCGKKSPEAVPPVDPPEELEAALFKPGDFQNPSVCGSCHTEIFKAWSGSMHAAAWVNELYQPDYIMANNETNQAVDVFCGECHAPVAVRVGQLPPSDGSLFDDISNRGVSCDFCHTISEVKNPFNVQSVSHPGRTKRGPRGDTISPAHDTAYSDVHTDSKFCGACHNVIHPSSGAAVIDTYDDWLAGPYAAQGIRCQDCHMTPTPGVGKNPGHSSIMGQAKEREHIATHFFVGGSVWTLARNGYTEHAKMAEANLKAAATIDLDGSLTEDGLDLIVHVNNVGAGHSIPTGVTYIRQMWLEVTVTNGKGETVFLSGHPDEANHIDADAVYYRKLFIDAQGNETSKSWLAEEIGYDRRIPPKGTDTETYQISADGDTFTATVRLLYRTTTQAVIDTHFAGQNLKMESIEMTKAVISITK